MTLSARHHTDRRNQWQFIPLPILPQIVVSPCGGTHGEGERIGSPSIDPRHHRTGERPPSISSEDWDKVSMLSGITAATLCSVPTPQTRTVISSSNESLLRTRGSISSDYLHIPCGSTTAPSERARRARAQFLTPTSESINNYKLCLAPEPILSPEDEVFL